MSGMAMSDLAQNEAILPLRVGPGKRPPLGLRYVTARWTTHAARMRCVIHRQRNAFAVVPAKAGTHNHRCELLCAIATTSPAFNIRRGVGPCFRRDDTTIEVGN